MKKPELDKLMKDFELKGKTSEELNSLRSEIFNSLDAGDIRTTTKDKFLKDLYRTATIKGIFFIRAMERKTQDLPKTPEEVENEEDDDQSYEESYQESYQEDESYEDEDDEEETKP